MALVLKDRVKETSAVVGTGTATLLGAETGYQSFSVIGNGNTCYYTIQNTDSGFEGEWEVGLGAYTSPDQLSRDTVLSSSNAANLVSFSAGSKIVFVTYPAERAVALNAITTELAADTVPFAGSGGSGFVSSTVAFKYQQSLNQLQAPVFYGTNGISVYSNIITYNYTIPSNSTAFSYGPIATANGVSLTIPSGQPWVVFPPLL
jgi:hypothetical protein